MDVEAPKTVMTSTAERASHAELIRERDYGIILVNDEKHLFTQITSQSYASVPLDNIVKIFVPLLVAL